MSLEKGSCEACRADSPRASAEEQQEWLGQLPEWQIEEVEGVAQLVRTFKFSNFTEALAFTQKVGVMADAEDHHPALLTEWGKVTVRWWTHKIKGLHKNDFICAAKTDRLSS